MAWCARRRPVSDELGRDVDAGASSVETRRAALLVEYDGTDYQGLQWQAHTSETIQGKVEDAVRRLGAPVPKFICAGRTDAGVHASGQVIAVNVPMRIEERRIALAMNAVLPRDIRVRRACHCAEDFSPRHDAIMRTYVYRLCARTEVPPLARRFTAFTPHLLDEERAMLAAEAFRGKWELKEWRSGSCQALRTFLTISEARATPPRLAPDDAGEMDPSWRFLFRARSFLHHQVRFMVGAVVAVGCGRLTVDELRAALVGGTRPAVVKMESACGLCLTEVRFAEGKNPFPRDGDGAA